MLCGSWLRETTLGFTFFFSSLRLLDISYFYPVSHFNLTWTNDVRRATPGQIVVPGQHCRPGTTLFEVCFSDIMYFGDYLPQNILFRINAAPPKVSMAKGPLLVPIRGHAEFLVCPIAFSFHHLWRPKIKDVSRVEQNRITNDSSHIN